jgi:hypothetical protein
MSELPEPTRRPLWRRLLRWCGWSIAGVFALCLLLIAALVLINWQDEPLTPEAQAWLVVPENPVPDAENAWLAMIAIGVEKQPGAAVGRQIIQHLKEAPNPTGMAEAYLDQFGPAWQFSDIDTSLCNIGQNGPRILARQAELQALVSQQQEVLARYYAAIALPDFHEEASPSAIAFLPYAPAAKAACLARIDLALRLLAGDASAEAGFVQHQRYWLIALQRSQVLIGALVANTQIQSDQALLQSLLAAKNHGAAQALNALRADLQAFATLDENALMARPLAGEFRVLKVGFERTRDLLMQRASGWYQTRWVRLIYHPQATLNQLQAMMISPDGGYAMCGRHYLVHNPMGRILACMGAGRYQEYFGRIRATQQTAKALLAAYP